MNTKYLGLKILEHNGFEPDEEILALVEANLVDILEDRDVVLTEGATEDDYYRHVLDKNGYTMTDRNVKILKEGLETGKFLIYNLNEEEAEFLMEAKKGGMTQTEINSARDTLRGAGADNNEPKEENKPKESTDDTGSHRALNRKK